MKKSWEGKNTFPYIFEESEAIPWSLEDFRETAGDPFCSPGVVLDLVRWYKEARDLAREALNFVGSHDSDEYKKMVEKLKELDSRSVL